MFEVHVSQISFSVYLLRQDWGKEMFIPISNVIEISNEKQIKRLSQFKQTNRASEMLFLGGARQLYVFAIEEDMMSCQIKHRNI